MSTQQSNLADRLALFDSEWLQTIVAKDQSQLPPPLPNQLGGMNLGEGLPSTLEGSGAQLADLYFERLSERESSSHRGGVSLRLASTLSVTSATAALNSAAFLTRSTQKSVL